MTIRSTIIIYLKELKDILRDRRTILSMILFPILLMPVMSIGIIKFTYSRIEKIRKEVSVVAWVSSGDSDELQAKVGAVDGVDVLAGITDSTLALDMLREKDVDAVVIVPVGFYDLLEAYLSDETEVPPRDILLYSDDTRQKSQFTAQKVSSVIVDYRSELVEDHLSDRGLPPGWMQPFAFIRRNVASAEEMGRLLAGSFLPYIVILMALMGAMYPAIDLTAGEKERGTLETLLVSGVSRVDIVIGKFLTVFTASIVTTVLAISSLAATAAGLFGMSPEQTQVINFNVEPVGVIFMVAAMIPLGAIFASLLMTLSLFAKSYREAQSYISPLMIVVILPAMASLMPDTELSKELALVPVLNVSMMMKDAMQGAIDPVTAGVTMAVNLFLAAVGLALVLRMFRRESVLFRI